LAAKQLALDAPAKSTNPAPAPAPAPTLGTPKNPVPAPAPDGAARTAKQSMYESDRPSTALWTTNAPSSRASSAHMTCRALTRAQKKKKKKKKKKKNDAEQAVQRGRRCDG